MSNDITVPSAPLLFDSHSHYTDDKFGNPDALLTSLFSSGVGRLLIASSDLEDSKKAVALAEKYPGAYAAVGIHPQECGNAGEYASALRSLAKSKKVVAIGEIGLDYYYEGFDKELQKKVFSEQLSLAGELNLPVIIHDRDAHGDVFDIVRAHPEVIGVLHSASVSPELAAEYVKRGYYISFSGVITFKNASRVCETLASVPLDRLLIETDCPYLAPVPKRGELNHSGYLIYTAHRAAELRGIDDELLIRSTFENASRLFGIDV